MATMLDGMAELRRSMMELVKRAMEPAAERVEKQPENVEPLMLQENQPNEEGPQEPAREDKHRPEASSDQENDVLPIEWNLRRNQQVGNSRPISAQTSPRLLIPLSPHPIAEPQQIKVEEAPREFTDPNEERGFHEEQRRQLEFYNQQLKQRNGHQ